MAHHRLSENGLQFSDISPTYDNFDQMQPFQDIFDPGQDLLFGFMNDNINIAAFDLHEPIP
jgi:hypothetical protein